MDDKNPKYSTIIDFLFPFDMSFLIESKKMETSAKVIILGFIFYGIYLAAIETSQFLLKDVVDATLDDARNLILGTMFGYVLLYLILSHAAFGLLAETIVVTIKQWRSPKHKFQEPTSEKIEATQENHIDENPAPKVQAAEVQEKPAVKKVRKTKPFIINLPDPSILENYIKSNADTYSDGEGVAILFIVLFEKEVIKGTMADFHTWLEGLIYNTVGYTGLNFNCQCNTGESQS